MTTGLNPQTFEHLQLGAGLFLRGFDCAAADAADLQTKIAAAIAEGSSIIGATRGGGSLQVTPTWRTLEADGLRSPVKGDTVIDSWTVKLTGTMLEITPRNFAAALVSASTQTQGSVTTLTVRADLAPEDYIPSLCWIGDTAQGFVLIELTDVINLKGAAFTFTDKGEGTLPFEFQAHQRSHGDAELPLRVMFFT